MTAFAYTLDKRITIQHKTLVSDGWGSSTETWANLISTGDGKVWANRLVLNGKEFITAGAETAQSSATWRIRKMSGIKSSMRILYEDEIYNITSVQPGPTNVYIDLPVTAGVNEG